jgi:O-acetyl-ADP-ribose deacetylase (regulator of RNase III)
MFKYIVGNILDTECKYILNPVNCVGTMGKGLALQIAKAYPESVNPYKEDCQDGSLSIGNPTSFKVKDGKTIIHFPTKEHWRDPSKYRYIEAGLERLAFLIELKGKDSTMSFAIPPLGCGLGGLKYDFVHELIQQYLGEFKNIIVELYVEQDWYDKHVKGKSNDQ